MITETDGKALLQAILDDPADDLVRLAYADWLDEGGQDGRAHYVRHHLKPGHRRHVTWADTDYAWLSNQAEFRQRYRERVPAGTKLGFRRGFVESVRCPLDAWLRHGPAIARAHPVTRAEITDRSPNHVDREPGFDGWSWSYDDSVWRIEANGGHWLPERFIGLVEKRWFPTDVAALDALSLAALAWARLPDGER